ncbi:ABC transporter substrate-binding protein [bacterium]|nr:ABC transporter substrate-binding protein [bacterium]
MEEDISDFPKEPYPEERKKFSFFQIITRSFSRGEYRMFQAVTALFVIGMVGLVATVSDALMVEVPVHGGELSEGVIGTPRFINPLLAVSDADRDATALLYSGLLRITPDGSLAPDLARDYDISEDGLLYTFALRDDIYFHDGEKVTADDVVFTVSRAKDPAFKSPKRASFEGISVSKKDDRTVEFALTQAYAPFLENMTLGVLPEHIWKDTTAEQFASSEKNIEPVGSGPYLFKKIKRNSSDVPEYIELAPFENYIHGKPYIERLRIVFVSNEDELISLFGDDTVQNINAISPQSAAALREGGIDMVRAPLPRIFAVFFNQNQAPLFADIAVRKALVAALDRDAVINIVLSGFGTPIIGPIPPGSLGYFSEKSEASGFLDAMKVNKDENTGDEEGGEREESRLANARAILERNDWVFDEDEEIWMKKTSAGVERLSFSISTSDAPELKKAATLIAGQWKELGAAVDVKIFEKGDLEQNVIRPRKYDALFFGEIVGRDADLYAFWHSSQRLDPGLNVALYTSISSDRILEKARTSVSREGRYELYHEFEKEIMDDAPAAFVYAPDFIYIITPKLQGVALPPITVAADRFSNVHEWFVETKKTFIIFAD